MSLGYYNSLLTPLNHLLANPFYPLFIYWNTGLDRFWRPNKQQPLWLSVSHEDFINQQTTSPCFSGYLLTLHAYNDHTRVHPFQQIRQYTTSPCSASTRARNTIQCPLSSQANPIGFSGGRRNLLLWILSITTTSYHWVSKHTAASLRPSWHSSATASPERAPRSSSLLAQSSQSNPTVSDIEHPSLFPCFARRSDALQRSPPSYSKSTGPSVDGTNYTTKWYSQFDVWSESRLTRISTGTIGFTTSVALRSCSRGYSDKAPHFIISDPQRQRPTTGDYFWSILLSSFWPLCRRISDSRPFKVFHLKIKRWTIVFLTMPPRRLTIPVVVILSSVTVVQPRRQVLSTPSKVCRLD
jgi:hypothetical protein